MFIPYTTPQIIGIAKISQFLALADIEKSGLYGGGQDLDLPQKIYCVRKNVEYIYNLSNNESSLINTGNFLFALCAPYNFRAAAILINGGGSVSPIIPSPGGGIVKFPIAGIVGGVKLPISEATVYQDNRLLGLGSTNNGDIQIFIAGTPYYNYGNNKSFDYDPNAATITLLNGNTFNQGDDFWCDTNQ